MSTAFQQPPGTRKATIPLTRNQRKLIFPVLGWIKKHAPTNYRTVALDYCCLHSTDLIVHPGWPRIVIATDGPTKPFRYYPHPDQNETINLSLDFTKKAIGLDDDGAALVYIAATFILTWHGMTNSSDRKVRALYEQVVKLFLVAKAGPKGGTK